jgi:hypothetical protein
MLVSRVPLQTANVERSFLDGFISWSHPHSARDSETGLEEINGDVLDADFGPVSLRKSILGITFG